MKKQFVVLIVMFNFVCTHRVESAINSPESSPPQQSPTQAKEALPQHVLAPPVSEAQGRCKKILESYSRCLRSPLRNLSEVKLSPGEELICHDNKKLDFYQRMEDMDLASMLAIPYKSGQIELPVVVQNEDPGRLRSEVFFKAVYGREKSEVQMNLVDVEFLGQTVDFNRKNGAARALAKVSKELIEAMKSDSELRDFLNPWTSKKLIFNNPEKNGDTSTFLWRVIKGTNRLSNHSFGVSIDLFEEDSPEPYYWLWEEADRRAARASTEGKTVTRAEILKSLMEKEIGPYLPRKMAKLPKGLVDVFERNGFIWGGKWNHFDAMHFEYRPEFFDNLSFDCSLEN